MNRNSNTRLNEDDPCRSSVRRKLMAKYVKMLIVAIWIVTLIIAVVLFWMFVILLYLVDIRANPHVIIYLLASILAFGVVLVLTRWFPEYPYKREDGDFVCNICKKVFPNSEKRMAPKVIDDDWGRITWVETYVVCPGCETKVDPPTTRFVQGMLDVGDY